MQEGMTSKAIGIGLDGTIEYQRNGDKVKCVIQYITGDFTDTVVVTSDPRVCAGEDVVLNVLPPLRKLPIKCAGRIIRRSESDGLFKDCRGYLAQIFINHISRMDRKRLELVIAQRDAFIKSSQRVRLKEGIAGFGRPEEVHKLDMYSILVVDDEVPNLNALERTLRREYSVFAATNGKDALSIMEQNDIGLIIADQRMPGMTGVEFLEKTLQKYPNTIRTILTAYTDEDLLFDAINKVHVHKYIRKPWKPEEITTTVREVIDTYKANRTHVVESKYETASNEYQPWIMD